MAWQTEDGRHEGRAAIVVRDGREVQTVRGDALILTDGTTVPDSETAGWQSRCTCGWAAASMVERVADPDATLTSRQVFDPSGGPATQEVEHICHDEWRVHVEPRLAIDAVHQAAEDCRIAEQRLKNAVAEARFTGSSWAEIGDAAGISRQSAHERWRRIDPRTPPQPGEAPQAGDQWEVRDLRDGWTGTASVMESSPGGSLVWFVGRHGRLMHLALHELEPIRRLPNRVRTPWPGSQTSASD